MPIESRKIVLTVDARCAVQPPSGRHFHTIVPGSRAHSGERPVRHWLKRCLVRHERAFLPAARPARWAGIRHFRRRRQYSTSNTSPATTKWIRFSTMLPISVVHCLRDGSLRFLRMAMWFFYNWITMGIPNWIYVAGAAVALLLVMVVMRTAFRDRD